MIWLYRLLYLPGLLLGLPYYLIRMWRRGGYARGFHHRFGYFPDLGAVAVGKQRIWLQAVSVGEMLAIQTIVNHYSKQPDIELVITTTTSTGYVEALKRYKDKALCIGIFPLDFWLCSRTAWRRIRPDVLILTEGELWPEHLHQAARRKRPIFLINARLSDRSFQRYRKIRNIAKRLLQKFTEIYAASERDRKRFLDLGCAPDMVTLTGSIKFDVEVRPLLDPVARENLRHSMGFSDRTQQTPFVLVGASTWPGEEVALLKTQAAMRDRGVDCRLLLVPRHAERGSELARLLAKQTLRWAQRSKGISVAEGPLEIYLADTTGELPNLMQAGDLAFIGKSLPPNSGGQTPIEAAGLGIPILMGPNMTNFREVACSLAENGAAQYVTQEDVLIEKTFQVYSDQGLRRSMQNSGTTWHQANRGSSERILEKIHKHLASHQPSDADTN